MEKYNVAIEKVPNGFDDVFIFVPTEKQIVRIAEGTGDNMLRKIRKKGM